MLLKVCKEPTGLKNQIGILCQRILTSSVYIYWVGDKIMHFCIVEKQTQTFVEYLQNFNAFDYIEIVIMVFIFIFSSKILSVISYKVLESAEI
jgi:hypothetical protein